VACFSTAVQVRYGLLDRTGGVRSHAVSAVHPVGWQHGAAVSENADTGNSRSCKGGAMYYVIEVSRWCIALHRETRMRLTYRRDYLPDRGLWRDFLVSAEPLRGANE